MLQWRAGNLQGPEAALTSDKSGWEMELKKIKGIPKVGHVGLINSRNRGATDGSL